MGISPSGFTHYDKPQYGYMWHESATLAIFCACSDTRIILIQYLLYCFTQIGSKMQIKWKFGVSSGHSGTRAWECLLPCSLAVQYTQFFFSQLKTIEV